jgi:hypothetical protein
MDGGKATSFTPEPGGKSLTIRRLVAGTVLDGDIEPKRVFIAGSARLPDGEGGWMDATRPVIESDFLAYVSAAKSAGEVRPQLVIEIARAKPNLEAIEMVLECAIAVGFTDVWLTKEPATPPKKLPVNPARPVAPGR